METHCPKPFTGQEFVETSQTGTQLRWETIWCISPWQYGSIIMKLDMIHNMTVEGSRLVQAQYNVHVKPSLYIISV